MRCTPPSQNVREIVTSSSRLDCDHIFEDIATKMPNALLRLAIAKSSPAAPSDSGQASEVSSCTPWRCRARTGCKKPSRPSKSLFWRSSATAITSLRPLVSTGISTAEQFQCQIDSLYICRLKLSDFWIFCRLRTSRTAAKVNIFHKGYRQH